MKKKILTIACLAVTGVAAISTATILASQGVKIGNAGNNAAYTCADIVFGEDAETNISASTDLTTKTEIDKVVTYSGMTGGTDFTLTEFNNAGYKAFSADPEVHYPLKLGAGNGKRHGKFTLTLKKHICKRAIIYAKTWADTTKDCKIRINEGTYQDVSTAYAGYTFDLGNGSSTLLIDNANGVTSDCRVRISKIVLRLEPKTGE